MPLAERGMSDSRCVPRFFRAVLRELLSSSSSSTEGMS
jgi:hypothetical protein